MGSGRGASVREKNITSLDSGDEVAKSPLRGVLFHPVLRSKGSPRGGFRVPS